MSSAFVWMVFSKAKLELVKIIEVMANMIIVLQGWGAGFMS